MGYSGIFRGLLSASRWSYIYIYVVALHIVLNQNMAMSYPRDSQLVVSGACSMSCNWNVLHKVPVPYTETILNKVPGLNKVHFGIWHYGTLSTITYRKWVLEKIFSWSPEDLKKTNLRLIEDFKVEWLCFEGRKTGREWCAQDRRFMNRSV